MNNFKKWNRRWLQTLGGDVSSGCFCDVSGLRVPCGPGVRAEVYLPQVKGAGEQKMMLMENKCYLMLDLCTPKTTLKFMGEFF